MAHHSLRFPITITLVLTLLLATNELASAQRNPYETSSLANSRHIAVPPPDEFLNQLLSRDPQVRVRALKMMGVSEPFLTQTTATGEDYTTISAARLFYGHYSEDRDLAVIALQMHDTDWASVLIHSSLGWEQIGVFNCWCRYEVNPLEGFIELRSVLRWPQTDVLVHESGGGSGLYTRELSVFHIQRRQLEQIYETTDKREDCHPTQNKEYCTLTEARIEYNRLSDKPAIIKVELESIEPVPSKFSLALEVYKDVRRLGCQVLLWDAAKGAFIESRQWSQSYCREAVIHDPKGPNGGH